MVELLAGMGTASSAWTTPLPPLSLCLSQRAEEEEEGCRQPPFKQLFLQNRSVCQECASPSRAAAPTSFAFLPSWRDTPESRGHQDFVRDHFGGHLPFPKWFASTSYQPRSQSLLFTRGCPMGSGMMGGRHAPWSSSPTHLIPLPL